MIILFIAELHSSKHRPIPACDVSESYIELSSANGLSQSNSSPSRHSGASLELFDKETSSFEPPYVGNPSYKEESGSDGLSVNSSDDLSRISDNSVSQMTQISVQSGEQLNTRDSSSQSDVDRILQAYRSPPNYPNGVVEQRNRLRNTVNNYHHPPPYREVRMMNGMSYQGIKPKGMKSILYSKSDNALSGSFSSGHSVSSYPERRLNHEFPFQPTTTQQQFSQKTSRNIARNGGIFKKVDKETMTDECTEESDSSQDGLSMYHQEITGNIQQSPEPDVSSYYSGHYEAYSGPSFSAYVEPHMSNLETFYSGNQTSSQGTSTLSIAGSGFYSQVSGETEMYTSSDSALWGISNSSTASAGVQQHMRGI